MNHTDRRVLIIGADGLRPDLVDAAVMPTYARLIREGTLYRQFYAAYPPHTRVNMTTLTTGTRPGRHGVVANVMVVPGAGEDDLVNTADDAQLRAFARATGEPFVLTPTLGDRLHAVDKRLAVAASSSPGAALLWNINHPHRILNPSSSYGDPDLVALHEKLGEVSAERGRGKLERARWATRALIDTLLDDPDNKVLTLWLSEPDSSQHFYGLGAPEVKEALAVVDGCVAQVLQAIHTRGLSEVFDLLLISDHGHANVRAHRSLKEYLPEARRELGLTGELVAAGDFIYATDRRPDRGEVEALVTWLYAQPWCDLVMVGDEHVEVTGAVPLELATGPVHHRRMPLLAVSPRWSDEANAFGVPGTVAALTSLAALKSTHGAASPYDLHAFCLGYGPRFRPGYASDLPCGTVDIAPTVCALLGLPPAPAFDGRVLAEGLGDGAAVQGAVTKSVRAGLQGAEIELVTVGETHYFRGSKRAAAVSGHD